MRTIGVVELLVLLIVISVIAVVAMIPYWIIFRKAGFEPVLSLLMFLPLANIIVLWWFALTEWPALRQRQPQ